METQAHIRTGHTGDGCSDWPPTVHLHRGCPWGDVSRPVTSGLLPRTLFRWQTDFLTYDGPPTPAPPTPAQLSPLNSGFHSRASVETAFWNVTRDPRAEPESLLSPSVPPSVLWRSWQLWKLLHFSPGSSPAFDGSSSVPIVGSFSFTTFLKCHAGVHPALNPVYKRLLSSHIQTRPSPEFQTWLSL